MDTPEFRSREDQNLNSNLRDGRQRPEAVSFTDQPQEYSFIVEEYQKICQAIDKWIEAVMQDEVVSFQETYRANLSRQG